MREDDRWISGNDGEDKMKMKEFDIEEVKNYIRAASETSLFYVGADSHKTVRNRQRQVVFITAVVIHINGNAGGKVFSKVDILPAFKSNRERLMKEVELAIGVATEIVDAVGKRPLAVHLDLNNDPK